jgi:DNA helicase-2/ATP-dependent DNA helicase PcrA
MAQAQFLVRSMIARHQEGVPYKDMAVLFRASSHSFEVEGLLNKHQIPYQKYGGLKLTDTAHVKDIVAYLRVADNPRDAGSWHRLLLLLDGVGAKLAQRLVDSMSETEDPISVLEQTTHKQRAALHRIAAVLRSAQNDAIHVSDRINLVLHHYAPILSRDYGTEAQQRMDDLRQLGQLSLSSPSLEVFLQDLTLNPDSSRPRNNPREQDLLTLSTIHSAKGLEWAHVYVMQLLDGYFPPIRSWYDDAALEEERRLFYVAITRPKDTLMLTYPVEQYHHMAHETLTQPCRFLRSTPPEHLQLLHIGDGT